MKLLGGAASTPVVDKPVARPGSPPRVVMKQKFQGGVYRIEPLEKIVKTNYETIARKCRDIIHHHFLPGRNSEDALDSVPQKIKDDSLNEKG